MNHPLLRKLSRFAMVGVANALVYALATRLYADVLAVSAAVASGLGYATAVPLAFFGHRHLTFEARGALTPQFARFLGNHLLGFALAVVIAWLMTDLLGWPIWMGMGTTILAVPVVSYLVMDKWVFARP
ncbi:MAG: GtrA family protein [Acidovorax sp.]|uniref:GtrA family protein n=1 Tax=Acidovorax sp. TaxID=1872122 RepID=UPI0025B9D448|nr:GtrA family protein [Acidovorax sp.]MCE1191509.1 GtrA family protein [Acidovorax sp.]